MASCTPQPLHPLGEIPWCPLDRRLGGPQSQSECGGEEIPNPWPESKPTHRDSSIATVLSELSQPPRIDVEFKSTSYIVGYDMNWTTIIIIWCFVKIFRYSTGCHWFIPNIWLVITHMLAFSLDQVRYHNQHHETILLEKLIVTQLFEEFHPLWNLKVHYIVHKSSAPVPVLSQMKSVHNFPLYFPKIHPNIILPSTFIPQHLFPSVLLSNTSMHFSFLPCMLHSLPISPSLVKHLSSAVPHYAVFPSFPPLLPS